MADDIQAARDRLAAKFAGNVRTGGKGSVRRKKKAVHKSATTDDKKLGTTLKKLGVTNIPAIEEVNLFKNDGTIIHFNNPRVQASIPANTYVVSGNAEEKTMQEMLPGILNQLGSDSLNALRKVAENLNLTGSNVQEADEDEEVPDLVENFEEASEK